MMGRNDKPQEPLFYSFNLDELVPQDHLLRHIDRFLDLSDLHAHLAPFYSHTGRPSIDPELMIRMLIIGYCLGIRSERQLCEEVKLNLAYRWFCRLSIEDSVPDHSTFSKNRHGRFREAEALRFVFEQVLQSCIDAGLVGGEGFAVDASLVRADVEATPAHRTQEVNSTRTMIERCEERFAIKAKKLIGDTAYGNAELLNWMVNEKAIEPHVPVWEKGERSDGTFSRSDFVFDAELNRYTCPNGKHLLRYRKSGNEHRIRVGKDGMINYHAVQADCKPCPLKERCCPNMPARKVKRSVHEASRDVARAIAKTSAFRRSSRQRKQVEMLFAHRKRVLRVDRLRLRGLKGAQDEFLLTATAQNLRRMAKYLGTGPPGVPQMA